ncbi:hypothetical protein [Pseudonocardia sp. 73-21]|uniref:hypothetical protein n=1 Tax=Pseudonocardia sp. 73-21 TaxID=1895809 RepID=UPI0009685AE6|nr:hypothetical protein [Pseudonocardia sp. 73-21]OJY47531.1 MAG: hypothetical protein BGP03_32830 [Pseudonocardia sp. 73-21]
MQVTFTKWGHRRYLVTIDREQGPPLVPRGGPGYDDHLPHDIAHFAVEEQLGLALGVFGQLAAGGAGIFAPAPVDRTTGERRRAQCIAAAGRPDMARSEAVVRICTARWQASSGRAAGPVADHGNVATVAETERVLARFDELSARWRALPDGGSLVLDWPVSGSGSAPTRRRAPR